MKNKKSAPKKFDNVPAEAAFNEEDEQWELGKRDAKGKPVGEWKYWWKTTGHLCQVSFFEDGGKRETLTRFHPDGTWSVKMTKVDGEPERNAVFHYSKSRNKTTELILTTPNYKKVFRVEETYIRKGLSKWKNFDAKDRRITMEGELLLTADEYAKNFSGFDLPEELRQLVDFQNDAGIENFAEGFAVVADDKGLIENFCGTEGEPLVKRSNAKKFLSALMPLGDANGSGSGYVVWNDGKSKQVDQMPILVFGDEGGVHVVAQNLSELLQIVACDIEPMIDHDGVTFYKDDEHEPSEKIGEFRKWLKAQFGISPAKNPETIARKAQKKYKAPFQAWLKTLS